MRDEALGVTHREDLLVPGNSNLPRGQRPEAGRTLLLAPHDAPGG